MFELGQGYLLLRLRCPWFFLLSPGENKSSALNYSTGVFFQIPSYDHLPTTFDIHAIILRRVAQHLPFPMLNHQIQPGYQQS
jgi:hypothetical protein